MRGGGHDPPPSSPPPTTTTPTPIVMTMADNGESELGPKAVAGAKNTTTFQKWEKAAPNSKLKYGGREFIKGHVVDGRTDEDKLIVRIIQKNADSRRQYERRRQNHINEKEKTIQSFISPDDTPETIAAKSTPTFRSWLVVEEGGELNYNMKKFRKDKEGLGEKKLLETIVKNNEKSRACRATQKGVKTLLSMKKSVEESGMAVLLLLPSARGQKRDDFNGKNNVANEGLKADGEKNDNYDDNSFCNHSGSVISLSAGNDFSVKKNEAKEGLKAYGKKNDSYNDNDNGCNHYDSVISLSAGNDFDDEKNEAEEGLKLKADGEKNDNYDDNDNGCNHYDSVLVSLSAGDDFDDEKNEVEVGLKLKTDGEKNDNYDEGSEPHLKRTHSQFPEDEEKKNKEEENGEGRESNVKEGLKLKADGEKTNDNYNEGSEPHSKRIHHSQFPEDEERKKEEEKKEEEENGVRRKSNATQYERKPPPDNKIDPSDGEDNNGIILAPSCGMDCFVLRKKNECIHKKIKVTLNNVGDYVVFPLWWHRGFVNIQTKNKVIITVQLFATPSNAVTSQRSKRTKMEAHVVGRFFALNGLTEDLFSHWDETYSVEKFPPATKFFGAIDKSKNRHILKHQISQVPKIEQLVLAFEKKLGDISVDSVWLIRKEMGDDGFQEWHQDMKYKITKTIVLNGGVAMSASENTTEEENKRAKGTVV